MIYLEPFNFVYLSQNELLDIELIDHLIACTYKMCLQIIYLIYL